MIFNLITEAKEIFCKNGKSVEAVLDDLKKSISSHIFEKHVNGIKGNAESTYRSGNVNITKANIGLDKVENKADKDRVVGNADKSYKSDFALWNCLKETDLKDLPLALGETYQFKSEESPSLIRSVHKGSFLVVRIGIPTGAWTIQNVIIPFPSSESGGVSVVGFNHYEGNHYKGILRWKPSEGMLEAELTAVSDGWANSIYIIDVWSFLCVKGDLDESI